MEKEEEPSKTQTFVLKVDWCRLLRRDRPQRRRRRVSLHLRLQCCDFRGAFGPRCSSESKKWESRVLEKYGMKQIVLRLVSIHKMCETLTIGFFLRLHILLERQI